MILYLSFVVVVGVVANVWNVEICGAAGMMKVVAFVGGNVGAAKQFSDGVALVATTAAASVRQQFENQLVVLGSALHLIDSTSPRGLRLVAGRSHGSVMQLIRLNSGNSNRTFFFGNCVSPTLLC